MLRTEVTMREQDETDERDDMQIFLDGIEPTDESVRFEFLNDVEVERPRRLSESTQDSASCSGDSQISEVTSRSADSVASSIGLGDMSLHAPQSFDCISDAGSTHSRGSIGLPTSYPTRVLNIERYKGNLLKNRHDPRDDYSDVLSIGSRSAKSPSHKRPSKSIGLPSAYPAIVSRNTSNASTTVLSEDDISFEGDWNNNQGNGNSNNLSCSSLPVRLGPFQDGPSPIFAWPTASASTQQPKHQQNRRSSMPTPPIQSIMLPRTARHRRSTMMPTVFDEKTLSEIFS